LRPNRRSANIVAEEKRVIKSRARMTAVGRVATLAPARRPAVRAAGPSVCIGLLVGWDDKGPLVDFDGNPNGPVNARVAGLGAQVRLTVQAGAPQEIVLLVDPRPRRPPVLLGLLQPLGVAAATTNVEARVDGRRVEIDGRDEIVLRCGEASINLRRNGRVSIRGIEVETRAAGVNRIKGGSVAIN
jgi:hypothetical protein